MSPLDDLYQQSHKESKNISVHTRVGHNCATLCATHTGSESTAFTGKLSLKQQIAWAWALLLSLNKNTQKITACGETMSWARALQPIAIKQKTTAQAAPKYYYSAAWTPKLNNIIPWSDQWSDKFWLAAGCPLKGVIGQLKRRSVKLPDDRF